MQLLHVWMPFPCAALAQRHSYMRRQRCFGAIPPLQDPKGRKAHCSVARCTLCML